jgi:aspartate aminotransferase
MTEPFSKAARVSSRLDGERDAASDARLNPNVRGLGPSSTLAINERSDSLRRQGRTIFAMGLGQSPFPVPEPVVEALRANAFQKDYLPVQGLPELRTAVATHHQREFGIATTADHVLIGPGSKELMFLLQLVFAGDLLIPTPTWVSYEPQARIIGRRARWLPTSASTGWRVDANQLDAMCRADPGRPRILILNYPSNPTGTTYDQADLAAIAAVARRYSMILLSDEIYGKLHHDGRHDSIVRLYPEGTIFSGGLSKWCGAGGWRLGLFVFPDCLYWLRDAMTAVASETFTSTSAPIQHAAVRAFSDDPEIERYLHLVRRILAALGRHVTRQLEEAGAHVIAPQGGFYLFPDFSANADVLRSRGITTSMELCERLLEDTGVAILPGRDFGRPDDELTVRIAYVNFDGGLALEAARALPLDAAIGDDFLQSHCGDVLEAIHRVAEWINSRPGLERVVPD